MYEKLKELTKDTAVYGISTILSRFLNFMLVPFYTNVFLEGDYGIVSNVYAYIAFFNVVYLYGMDAAFMKYASLSDKTSKNDNYSTSFYSVLFTSTIFSLVIYSSRYTFGSWMSVPAEMNSIILYTILILFFDALTVIPFAHLRLIRKAKMFALLKTVNISLNVAFNLILILVYHYGIEAVFISNLAASFLTFVFLIPEIFRNLKFKINLEALRRMLKFGIPYLPAGLASMTMQVIDRPILEAITDLRTVGVYQANYKLGIFMMLFVSMFQYAWQPFFLNNAREKNAKEIFSKTLTYFVLAGMFIFAALSLFIPDLVHIEFHGKALIGKNYWDGLNIVPVILMAYLFNGIYVNLQAGIFIEEKSKYIPLVTGAGALANVFSNYLLIPKLG
ncbi:MAG TPA: oligosaccharide flippase family protein, partial [Ignavibacteriales bacterium]|nr:oligosaccharide flippase family protein [Ignavibacteriales bacterium]